MNFMIYKLCLNKTIQKKIKLHKLFNIQQYLLSNYYVLGILQDFGKRIIKKIGTILTLMRLIFY